MKKIYAFTLEGDDYPSSKFDSNLRLFAHMLYEAVYNYDDVDNNPLNINCNIIYNNIHYMYGGSNYCFDSDINKTANKFVNYEPFIIGNKSFGFTVNDEYIDLNTICDLMKEVLLLINVDYKYKVDTINYDSKNLEDESNRKRAINQLYNIIEKVNNRGNNLVKKREFNLGSFRRKIGLF